MDNFKRVTSLDDYKEVEKLLNMSDFDEDTKAFILSNIRCIYLQGKMDAMDKFSNDLKASRNGQI